MNPILRPFTRGALLTCLAFTMSFAGFAASSLDVGVSDLDLNEFDPSDAESDFALEQALNPDLEFSTPNLVPGKPVYQIDVFKDPELLGVNYEFMVVRENGIVTSVKAVSTATNRLIGGRRKWTIEGTFPLTVLSQKGKPWPWKESTTYAGSTMWWGLQIQGPYYIHATPHLSELGKRASMGCVRLNTPTAMETFDAVVNHEHGNALITIHSAQNAAAGLRAIGLAPGYINDQVEADLADIRAILRPGEKDYTGYGYARRHQALVWPTCRDVDCFSYFGKKKPN